MAAKTLTMKTQRPIPERIVVELLFLGGGGGAGGGGGGCCCCGRPCLRRRSISSSFSLSWFWEVISSNWRLPTSLMLCVALAFHAAS